MRVFHPILGLSLVVVLSACGGGGGAAPAATTTPTTTAADVTVSGTVTYTDYEISDKGIDFVNPTNKPIRGAVVELHNPLGTIVTASNTTETGGYSFNNAPANSSTISIVVKAALGTATAPDTKVINNTASDAIYSVVQSVTTVTRNVTSDFNAGSGWDTATSSYTSTRAAAPFAILDTIHQGRLFVQTADTAVVFPALNVQWSKDNKSVAATAQNVAIGDGPGTSFGEALWLNGSANLDTDEYDSAVIAHEWGHYFQDKLGRSDSIGGDHAGLNIVHPSLAMDEGFATAFGSMIMNDTSQINTFKTNPISADVLLADIENDLDSDTADTTAHTINIKVSGFWSEQSIIEVMWDLFDSAPIGGSDDDTLALGFTPLYNVMTNGNGYKNTPSFTSIYSFVYHLKIESPTNAAAIDTILANENIITSGNANEFENVDDYSMYTNLTIGVIATQDSGQDNLTTFSNFGNATSANDGGNKLFNHRFFKYTIATAGCYTFTATPTTTGDLTFAIAGIGSGNDIENATDPEIVSVDLKVGAGSAAIAALSDDVEFTFGMALASDTTLCDQKRSIP
jgi:hypothetical protein